MAKGLDVGTMNVISARREPSEVVFVRQRNSFAAIEEGEAAEQLLSGSDIPYARDGEAAYVVGEDALNITTVFDGEVRRPMRRGVLSPEESAALPVIKLVLEQVVGEAGVPGERLHYSAPADAVDADLSTRYHRRALRSVLSEMGYDPEPINEGLAVVYSELAHRDFTGLSVSFGAGMTNVCLAYRSVPVLRFAIARGGDWIDERTARATDVAVDEVTRIKETEFDLGYPIDVDGVEGALAVYYEQLLDYVFETFLDELADVSVPSGREVPVVVSGGTARPQGFETFFTDRLREADLPLPVADVRCVDDPLYTVARGALVAACSSEGDGEGTGTAADPTADADATAAADAVTDPLATVSPDVDDASEFEWGPDPVD